MRRVKQQQSTLIVAPRENDETCVRPRIQTTDGGRIVVKRRLEAENNLSHTSRFDTTERPRDPCHWGRPKMGISPCLLQLVVGYKTHVPQSNGRGLQAKRVPAQPGEMKTTTFNAHVL